LTSVPLAARPRRMLGRQLGATLLHSRETSIGALLVVLVVLVRLKATSYWSQANIQIILLSIALLLVLSIGELAVMIGRNFDLTVGSTVGLAAMIVGLLFKSHQGMPIALAFAIAVLVGTVIGIINGLAIVFLRVSSVVFTLGMLSVISGVTYLVANGNQVNPFNVPQGFVSLSISSPLGVPWLVVIALAFALVVGAGFRWTRTARSLYAQGSNPEAAQMRGLPAKRLIILSFVFSGAAAGLAGALYLSQYGLVQDTAGTGLELQAITIVIVGGASIYGGAGSVLGTAISTVLLGAMANGIAVLGYSTFWQDAMYGALLVLAVVGNSLSRRLEASRSLVRPELKL
jgi:rhamnose transport system permease protein